MSHSIRKSLAAIVLSCAAVVTAAATAFAVDPVCGDVNKSGTVTVGDALQVLKKAVGIPSQLSCSPFAAPLKTGQTICYDQTGAVIACAGIGEDGGLQKGIVRSFTDNGDGTITDNAAGLTWEKLSNDGSIHDVNNLYQWADALSKALTLNSGNFAGHNDWRVPNQFELYSLLNFGPGTLAIYPIFNTNCPQSCTVLTCSCTIAVSSGYWSSTTYLNGSTGAGAWALLFDGGFPTAIDKTFSAYARVVRTAS